MPRPRRSETTHKGRKPATTPEARELELSSMAYDLAEEQMQDGTASSQVLTHFLKMGSSRERLEQLRMEHEIEMMDEKRKQLQSQQRMDELFTNAIEAFKGYSGLDPGPDADSDGEEF